MSGACERAALAPRACCLPYNKCPGGRTTNNGPPRQDLHARRGRRRMPEDNVELRLEATVYTEVEVTAPDERAAKLKAREKTEECGWLIDEADEVYVEVID